MPPPPSSAAAAKTRKAQPRTAAVRSAISRPYLRSGLSEAYLGRKGRAAGGVRSGWVGGWEWGGGLEAVPQVSCDAAADAAAGCPAAAPAHGLSIGQPLEGWGELDPTHLHTRGSDTAARSGAAGVIRHQLWAPSSPLVGRPRQLWWGALGSSGGVRQQHPAAHSTPHPPNRGKPSPLNTCHSPLFQIQHRPECPCPPTSTMKGRRHCPVQHNPPCTPLLAHPPP